MARAIYLVAYDVSDPRRLARTGRCVKAHLLCGQKSFAECWMSRPERDALLTRLKNIIDIKTDRLHSFRFDPRQTPVLLGTAQRVSPAPFLIL